MNFLKVNCDHGDRPLHAVVGGSNMTESLFICRTWFGDLARPGQLDWRGCRVVMGDTSELKLNYQVLVNIDGSARLEWQDWKQVNNTK